MPEEIRVEASTVAQVREAYDQRPHSDYIKSFLFDSMMSVEFDNRFDARFYAVELPPSDTECRVVIADGLTLELEHGPCNAGHVSFKGCEVGDYVVTGAPQNQLFIHLPHKLL